MRIANLRMFYDCHQTHNTREKPIAEVAKQGATCQKRTRGCECPHLPLSFALIDWKGVRKTASALFAALVWHIHEARYTTQTPLVSSQQPIHLVIVQSMSEMGRTQKDTQNIRRLPATENAVVGAIPKKRATPACEHVLRCQNRRTARCPPMQC